MKKANFALRSVSAVCAMVLLCTACSNGSWETVQLSEYVDVPVSQNPIDSSIADTPSDVSSDTYISSDTTANFPSNDSPSYTVDVPGLDAKEEYLSAAEYGINNPFLVYVTKSNNSTYCCTEEEFLPSVAYMENGVIKDTMFDTFVFLPDVNFLYDYGPDDGGKAPLQKSDWQGYIRNHEFAKGYNMDALDAAVGKVKSALNLSDYKVNVIMPILYPVKSVTNFGSVNGSKLNFSKVEDRKEGVKWFVDEQIETFERKKYENIKVVGFYWFVEAMPLIDVETKNIAKYITEYVKSLNLTTLWIPYFKAAGYDKWKETGFDLVAMQPNFFPSSDAPNCGGEERLKQTADLAKKYNMGVEIEVERANEISVTHLKKYYRAGIEYGYMDAFHTFYMNQGPSVFYEFYNSADSYLHSAYTDTYKFIKKTLKINELLIK